MGHLSKEKKKSNQRKSSYQPIVPAVEQACRLLLCLGKDSDFRRGLTEVSREVGIHKSKGFSILNTLHQFGFVEKDLQSKTYSLGPGLLFLSRHVLDNIRYPEAAAPFLQRLAVETNGTVLFGLINGDHVIVVGKHEGNQNIGFTVRLGHRFHITLGAHGKSILAFMPETEREKVLSRKKVFFYLDPSRVDRELLKQEMDRCRALGYSQDIGNITPGVNAVSAPLFAHQDKLIGCLLLIGTFPEKRIQQYGPRVAEVAVQISQKLGADVETIYPKQSSHKGK